VKCLFLARGQVRVDFFLIAFHYDNFDITIIEIRNVNLIMIIFIKKDNFKDSIIFYYYYYYYIDSLFSPFFPYIFLILIDCRSLTIDRNRLYLFEINFWQKFWGKMSSYSWVFWQKFQIITSHRSVSNLYLILVYIYIYTYIKNMRAYIFFE
jgi:hypothetical protein